MANRVVEVSFSTETPVRIGVPAEMPEEAVKALIQLFSGIDNVMSARLGMMETLNVDGKSEFCYTIGIECTTDEAAITETALNALRSVPTGRLPIAIVSVTDRFFTSEAIVFYQRHAKKKSWLSRFSGS